MNILVTGAAGFIGFHVSKELLKNGHNVVGLDNINDYYDVNLKYGRLKKLGIHKEKASIFNSISTSSLNNNFKFIRLDLEDKNQLLRIFDDYNFHKVCNLAAQAGVRYSIENPNAYIESNIVGFLNILEGCRKYDIEHLIYASSSSVYGLNKQIPFKTTDNVDNPISLYAATKKSNELMAHTYTHLYGFKSTGLRFFTVYGPWGRPDMAMFLFTQAILKKNPIKVFNNGEMERDFTYIDDIVEGITRIIEKNNKKNNYSIYNIGNNNSVKLLDFIKAIENKLGCKAQKELLPMQPGDVKKTWADVSNLIRDYQYSPNTSIEHGVSKFVDWYREFYKI
ncbi:NAD-dependent epimerase [uncultured Croceitalea sp.]|uniref:NAD-dependent epimerase n=1 Tax=uncultured Croceitalea sp. TaxID=1798908 RepID=UPI00374FC723